VDKLWTAYVLPAEIEMSEAEKFDLVVRSSLESIVHVNACPDSEYPIRILEAHLVLNEGTWMEGSGGGEELAEVMNEAQEKRNLLLHNAIALLRSKPTWEIQDER